MLAAIAVARYDNNRANARSNHLMGGRDPLLTDREGILGEYVFGQLTGLPVDLETEYDTPPVHDFLLPFGDTLDIKTTRYKSGGLMAVTKKMYPDHLCDWYGLVTATSWADPRDCPTGTFRGGMGAETYFCYSHWKEVRPGRWGFHVEQRELIQPEEFMRLTGL